MTLPWTVKPSFPPCEFVELAMRDESWFKRVCKGARVEIRDAHYLSGTNKRVAFSVLFSALPALEKEAQRRLKLAAIKRG